MVHVTVYSAKLCPYCTAAKQLLENKGVGFEEIDVTFNPSGRRAMSERAGGATSVPQIFIGDHHVGGCDQLFQLDKDGGLDPLLTGE